MFITIAIVCKWINNYSKLLYENWGIKIPATAHCRQIYEMDSGPSFHGDGIRYHIFSYKNEDDIKDMLAWRSDEGITIFNQSYSEAVNAWLDRITVSYSHRPNYNECCYWYQTKDDNSEVLVLWDKSQSKLYIVESFL